MSNPRTKRQFAGSSADPAQRQITSFFSCSSSNSSPRTGGYDQAQTQASRQPLLPSSVQANLLSVGMRIRKSVPEGYKTCGPSTFTLWTDHCTSTGTNTSTTTTSAPTNATAATIPQHSTPRAATNELVPFCGINKVGGLGIQPTVARDLESDSDSDDHSHMVPELTLSQESVDSTASTASAAEPSRKRVYTENELHEPPTMLARPHRGWDEEVSPRSFAPSEWQTSRVMAVPKPRVKRSVWSGGSGQENGIGNGDEDEDFKEAEFLVFGPGPHEMDIS
ncbi:hypothetical protein E4U21_006111 [Claviceps maximensis]|nr:hypothetical protein E4U21_006111 [Claviceps maximensis]